MNNLVLNLVCVLAALNSGGFAYAGQSATVTITGTGGTAIQTEANSYDPNPAVFKGIVEEAKVQADIDAAMSYAVVGEEKNYFNQLVTRRVPGAYTWHGGKNSRTLTNRRH